MKSSSTVNQERPNSLAPSRSKPSQDNIGFQYPMSQLTISHVSPETEPQTTVPTPNHRQVNNITPLSNNRPSENQYGPPLLTAQTTFPDRSPPGSPQLSNQRTRHYIAITSINNNNEHLSELLTHNESDRSDIAVPTSTVRVR